MRISDVCANLQQAMSIKYNTFVYDLQKQNKQVLIMSLGEAFFDLPLLPMDTLPNPAVFHYSNSKGNPDLRKKLAEFFKEKYEVNIDSENEILITAGSKAAIYFTFMAILNPGDEVLIPEPFWVSYPEQVRLCSGVPVTIPYYKSVYHFEDYITENTKAIVINNPNNPSGHLFSENDLNYLISLAKKYDLLILSDEAYSEFVYNEKFTSIGNIDPEKKHSVIFNSISKNYGISGWRLGYVIASRTLISNILKINQHIITCAPSILELYVEKYFHNILHVTAPQITELMEKRKLVADYMNEIDLVALPGTATFYFFVSISPSQQSSEEFCTSLLMDHLISVVPGIGYGASCEKFIRVSIGTATLSEIKRGLKLIKDKIVHTSKIAINETVLVIAGGLWQLPLISYLKNDGYKVFVVDPYDESPGALLADKHIKADVTNYNKILNLVKDEHFSFITSDQSDISVNIVSQLNEYFNLPGNKFDITNLFVNKYKMRKYAERLGIPIPKYSMIANEKELSLFIANVGFPIILKPADSQSSKGIVKIDKENAFDTAALLDKCFEFTRLNYILAEEFVEGEEITVEGFASNFQHKTLAISLKKHFRTGIASELRYPANISTDLVTQIECINDKFVENSGLCFGITHAEYLINRNTGKIFLVEIACRGGGSLISSDIIKWVSGIDVYFNFLKNLKGQSSLVKSFSIQKRCAILKFFEFSSGKIKSIDGIQEIKNIKGIHTFHLSFKAGDTIKSAIDDRSRQGFYIAFAENNLQLDEIISQVDKAIKINYERPIDKLLNHIEHVEDVVEYS